MSKCCLSFFIVAIFGVAGISQEKHRDFHYYLGGMATPQLAFIFNQNNYGFAELDYRAKMGLQLGIKGGIEYKFNHQLEGNLVWSTLGQSYKDVIRGQVNEKVVELDYISAAIIYKRVFGYIEQWRDKRGLSNWYLYGGVQPGKLLAARTEFMKDGQQQDLVTYLTEDETNKNSELLFERGNPQSPEDLFADMDIMAVFGVGWQYWISSYTSIHVEWRNGIGLKDINAPEWQLPNRLGAYQSSHNGFTGINISVQAYY